MNRGRHIAALVAVFTFGAAAIEAAGQEPERFSTDEIATLLEGGVVHRRAPGPEGGSVIAGSSFAMVDAPPAVVWATLTNVADWKCIFPNTFEARTLTRRRNASAVKMTIGNRFFSFDCVLTVVENPQRFELFYELNKKRPHDIEEAKGHVRLVALPQGRTLIAFTTMVEVPFGPIIALMGDAVTRVMEQRILDLPGRLRRWVEKNRRPP
ncbi:MAG: SRPBCC family protein [Deltaproteobacteria bacterium]|nr:SRPBCC family protein [Deltaproteobacteria bacterium]